MHKTPSYYRYLSPTNWDLKNRFDAQANKINVDLANNTVEKSKKEWLPDINATGDIRYNTQLQTMVFPDGFGNGVNTVIAMGTKNNTLFCPGPYSAYLQTRNKY